MARRRIFPIVVVVLAALAAGAGVGAFFGLAHDLPQIRNLEEWKPSAITRVLSADGVTLAEWYAERREPVPLKDIPEPLIQGLLATEDRSFYSHMGVDLKGLARAVVNNVKSWGFREGASTITQQLAKNLFLTPEKTLKRKFREAILALQLERRYTKDEILEIYLNTVYFGSGAYGVRVAADAFFGKELDELTVGECALIAGMPKSPSRYSPLVSAQRARKRRDLVLSQMLAVGAIRQEEYTQSVGQPVVTARGGRNHTSAPYFVAHVRGILEEAYGDKVLNQQGLTVYTTLRYDMQRKAETALTEGLDRLGERIHGSSYRPGLIEGAVVSLDTISGEILAMVGGHDYHDTPFNRATMARRQPGSAFKPIVYAFAVEQGASQADLVLDAPVAFPSGRPGVEWRPRNYSRTYEGEISMRRALAKSRNIPAVRLINSLSPSRVVDFAQQLGIRSDLAPNLSLALGTSEVTLLELTSAYAVFPSRGVWSEPRAILEVVDRNGRRMPLPRPHRRVVMSEAGAAIMCDMLQGVVGEGTGRQAKAIGRPLGGKTGTTNDCKDALFVGFSPDVATGVWVGRDSSLPIGPRETGGRAALPIWVDFMAAALEDRPVKTFDIPRDMVTVRIDPRLGRPLGEDREDGVRAVFRKDNVPTG
ncbi:MAG: penicillin-binding protein 1A [Desulfatibacillaceae bacterium]